MPELRKDPIVGRWVIIATERVRRCWDRLGARDRALLAGRFLDRKSYETLADELLPSDDRSSSTRAQAIRKATVRSHGTPNTRNYPLMRPDTTVWMQPAA